MVLFSVTFSDRHNSRCCMGNSNGSTQRPFLLGGVHSRAYTVDTRRSTDLYLSSKYNIIHRCVKSFTYKTSELRKR